VSVSCAAATFSSATSDTFVADGVTADVNGIVYTVQSLTGWWDSPPVRSATMEAQPWGEFPTVYRENARAITLVLVAHASLPNTPLGSLLCFTAIAMIKAAVFQALSVPVLLEVADAVNDVSTLVRLASPVRVSILGAAVAVKAQIMLLAPDPTLT
jgi:hypothetical protein